MCQYLKNNFFRHHIFGYKYNFTYTVQKRKKKKPTQKKKLKKKTNTDLHVQMLGASQHKLLKNVVKFTSGCYIFPTGAAFGNSFPGCRVVCSNRCCVADSSCLVHHVQGLNNVGLGCVRNVLLVAG